MGFVFATVGRCMRTQLFFRAVLFGMLILPGLLQATTYRWNQNFGSWNDPNNWSPNGIPGAADTAIIAGSALSSGGTAMLPQGGTITVANVELSCGGGGCPTLGTQSGGAKATLTVTGTFTWTGGTFGYTGGAVSGVNLNLPVGSQWNIGSGGALVLSECAVNNYGTVNWTNNPVENQGNVWVNQSDSTMNLHSDGTLFTRLGGGYPYFTNATGATLNKVGGTGFTSLANYAADIALGGTVNISTGTLGLNTRATFPPFLRLLDGVVINGPGRLVYDMPGSGPNSICYVDGTVTVNGSGCDLLGGRIIGTNTTAARFVATGGATFNWIQSSRIEGKLNVAANTTFNINGDVLLDGLGTPGGLEIAGTVNLFTLTGGSSAAQNGATLTVLSGGKFYPASGKRFDNLSLPLRNNGLISPETNNVGAFSTFSDFAQSETGILQVDIAGASSGQYDAVDIMQYPWTVFGGNATLAGVLRVNLINGFVPVAGNSFSIFKCINRSGQFNTLELPPLSDGKSWRVQYSNTGVTLSVAQATSISNFSKPTGGNFQFTIAGGPASSVVVQASTNLTSWTSVATNAPFNGTFNYSDPETSSYSMRFYRVLINP
jgi:hypothetical protein